MRKAYADLLAANDHNEMLAHLLADLEALDRRVKALEQAAEDEAPRGGKKKG